MGTGRKGTRQKTRRSEAQAEDSPRRKAKGQGKKTGTKALREESGTDSRKKRDPWKGFGEFLKKDRIAKVDPGEYESKAESAFWSLTPRQRNEIRASGKYSAYTDWFEATDHGHRAKRAAFGPTLKMGSPKMLDKHIRQAMKMPAPPKNPFVALMEPMVLVPDHADDKVVIANAGSIVRLMNQATLYRDWVSPVTHRADELLVQYGKPGALKFGWLTNKQHAKIMKPSQGPTFLVATKADDKLIAWEQVRLKVALSRRKDPTNWVAPWLVQHGPKYSRELREVTRFFGGKPIKNEPFDDRCMRLFTLILHTELDMATAKSKNKKSKKNKDKKHSASKPDPKPSKKSKKHKDKKSGKKSATASSDRITAKHDDYVIKRLIKENPRRAGSDKAKIWDKLKKGMTVGEFAGKGGSRSVVRFYIQNGWVKLLRDKSGD